MGLSIPSIHSAPGTPPPLYCPGPHGDGEIQCAACAIPLSPAAPHRQFCLSDALSRPVRYHAGPARLGWTSRARFCYPPSSAHQTSGTHEHLGLCPMARWSLAALARDDPLPAWGKICAREKWLSRTSPPGHYPSRRAPDYHGYGGLPSSLSHTGITSFFTVLVT